MSLWKTDKYFTPFCIQQSPHILNNIFNDRVYRNFNQFCTFTESKRVDIDCGKYSTKCWYRKIVHNYYIHSCYRITNKNKVLKISYSHSGTGKNGIVQENIKIGFTEWFWQSDQHGIYITDGVADYHPASNEIRELIRFKNVKPLIIKAIKNYRKRLALKLAEKDLKEKARNIKVTMQDSLSAGNCEAGTVSFIQRHFGFTPTKEDYVSGISAAELLELDEPRAKRAVMVALERQLIVSI